MSHHIRRLLAVADASPEGERLARTAAALARRLDAGLVALWVLRRPSPSPAETFARGAGPMHEVFEHQAAAEAGLSTEARLAFVRAVGAAGVPVDFRPTWDDGAASLPPTRAGDLFVVGHPKLHDQPDALTAERLLIASGRPVLILPSDAESSVDGPVLICWNGSPAAGRAVEDALPLIRTAGSATILVVDDAASLEGVEDLTTSLREHGVKAAVRWTTSGSATVAETIAAVAGDLDAGLIVLGGYSRSPTLERIFGGVTRSFLAGAPRPLLLSHVPAHLARAQAPVGEAAG